MSPLIDQFDAALVDLDGVIYLGAKPVPGAPAALADLRRRGVPIGFVTNNAARPRAEVAAHLQTLGIEAGAGDIVTSAQSVAAVMANMLPASSPVLVVGTQALRDEVANRGFRLVDDWRNGPVAVVQGLDPSVSWERLTAAAHAIQRGARWFATNLDINRPTDLGLEPGTGAQVAVVSTCVDAGLRPEVSGKPYPPLLTETMRRLDASRPIFVGDRLDTDVQGAHNVGISSLWVCTGSHTAHDLLHAGQTQRPSYIGFDVQALLRPPRVAQLHDGRAVCREQTVEVRGGKVQLLGSVPADREAQLDVLWALVNLAWQTHLDQGADELIRELDQLPSGTGSLSG